MTIKPERTLKNCMLKHNENTGVHSSRPACENHPGPAPSAPGDPAPARPALALPPPDKAYQAGSGLQVVQTNRFTAGIDHTPSHCAWEGLRETQVPRCVPNIHLGNLDSRVIYMGTGMAVGVG
jgi:hypothetical protein